MKTLCFALLIGVVVLGADAGPLSAAPSDLSQVDVATFRNHLVQNKLDTRWDGPPARIDSEEIRRAYGDQRFYFTFKAPPLPPGAQLPKLIERYNQAMQEHEKHALRITVGIDQKQHSETFRTSQDFNLGLMPVKTDDDARIAAAAILSLIGNDQVYPTVVNAREVNVVRTQSGWTCVVTRPREFDGKVEFDLSGHCSGSTKQLNYVPPVPP